MKRITATRLAAAVGVALLSTSAIGATMMANNSNKGSLLIFPQIDVSPGVDTLITIANDSSTDVQVKCYYRSTEPVPTPLPTSFNTAFIKHTMDFTFTLTRNQPITWSAFTGRVLGGGIQVAAPFNLWPDGSARTRGELKCFAVGTDGNGNYTQINFNQLFGNASIVGSPFGQPLQAYEYNAWAFQALAGTLAQGQPVGNTPGTMSLFSTLTTTLLTLNPSAPNPGCVVGAGLPNVGNACGAVGTNAPFQTDNAHIAFTGVIDIDSPSGTANFVETGNFKLLDFNVLPTIIGINRSLGGNYDVYATFTATGSGVWASGANFVTTSVATLDVKLYASPSSGTPMVLGAPAPAGVTPGTRDFLLGTAQIVADPTNFGTVSLDVNNTAAVTLTALLQFNPAGGPTGPLTGATGFFQSPVPFVINIGSQAGGNVLNTTWVPFGTGYRVQTLDNRGGGDLSFVAQIQGGYDSCPNILVGAFQPNGQTGTFVVGGPNAQITIPAANAGTQISVAACNQDLTQRARPFITKYTWTFWNEDESSRTGQHECGDSWYETFFPRSGGNGVGPAPAQNPGPFVGFPLAQFSSLGTPTAYFRLESVADTAVCANAVHFGMVGVSAQANNGIFVRGTNLIGRGTQAGVITWDPGPGNSYKK